MRDNSKIFLSRTLVLDKWTVVVFKLLLPVYTYHFTVLMNIINFCYTESKITSVYGGMMVVNIRLDDVLSLVEWLKELWGEIYHRPNIR